jgi:glutathione reductase (NADPH)
LTPVAIAEGQAVAQALFGNEPGRLVRALVPTAVFCRPEVAKVGLSEQQSRAAGHEIDVFISTFIPLEHRLTGRPERCLVKLIVERQSQRVLGCHIVAPTASEIIQGFTVALRCGVTKAQLDACLGVHPTIAEELVSMRRSTAV